MNAAGVTESTVIEVALAWLGSNGSRIAGKDFGPVLIHSGVALWSGPDEFERILRTVSPRRVGEFPLHRMM